jgi:hypothetical protein
MSTPQYVDMSFPVRGKTSHGVGTHEFVLTRAAFRH